MQGPDSRLNKYFNLAIDIYFVRSRSFLEKDRFPSLLKFEHDDRLNDRYNTDINLPSIVTASYFLSMLIPGHSRNYYPSISSVFISNAISVPLAAPSSNRDK